MSEISINYTSKFTVSGIPEAHSVTSPYTVVSSDVPTISHDDFNFGGWFSDTQFTTQITVGSTLSESTTLYAKWTHKNLIEVYNSESTLKISIASGATGAVLKCKDYIMDDDLTVKVHTPWYYMEEDI